jgi:hypothetical protein
MNDWYEQRTHRIREFFGLSSNSSFLDGDSLTSDLTSLPTQPIDQFNIEWHVIPSANAVPLDDDYIDKLYPMTSRDFGQPSYHGSSCREALMAGHRRHQGRILGIETTMKPRYLPNNRQYYGTAYGFDPTADPFAPYLGRAGFVTGTRYAHDYASLRSFIDVVNKDWHAQPIMPPGYRLTICSPAVFNFIGNLFHPEWSETETLELGFYRDDHGNARCYAVGSNRPGDFSYIHEIESNSDWTVLGFRVVLVPE